MLGNTFLESLKNARKIIQYCETFNVENARDLSRILVAGLHS